MKQTLLTGAAALLLVGASAAGVAHASGPPTGTSASASFYTPGGADGAFGSPQSRDSEKREQVSEQTRQSLVQMAIKAGQTSSKSAEEPEEQ